MWRPDKRVVSAKETIGRRAFEEPFFERKGKRFAKVSLFYESRPNEEGMSFDRLGIRPRDFAGTREFLTPLAMTEGNNRSPPRPFFGWLGILVGQIPNLQVRPDPITEPIENPLHALLPLERFRQEIHADNLAYRLAMVCGDLIEPHTAMPDAQTARRPGLGSFIRRLLRL
jgi:hypothetical protein